MLIIYAIGAHGFTALEESLLKSGLLHLRTWHNVTGEHYCLMAYLDLALGKPTRSRRRKDEEVANSFLNLWFMVHGRSYGVNERNIGRQMKLFWHALARVM